MTEWQLFLALLVALAIGFLQGVLFKSRSKHTSTQPTALDQHYFQGLNFLLNEQPDAAIDSFIQALEVNSETLETHLALGKLLRKRGEVDRAIKIHQNLLARPGLSLEQSQQAQYELATDFAKAGLLDRAEGLLTALVEHDGPFKQAGLERLLEVYRDEKEWQQGLEVLQTLSGSRFSKNYDRWSVVRAHFCCELAEQHLQEKDYTQAQRWAKQALGFDKQSVRASLLIGRLEIESGGYSAGIQQLKKMAEQNPEYIAEAFPFLRDGYTRLGQRARYKRFLAEMNENFPLAVTQIELADVIADLEGNKAAAEMIANEIQRHPSGAGLHKLLDYYLAFTEGKTQEHLRSLQQVMARIISRSPHYQCRHCGFKSQELDWHCPSCKRWGTIKPYQEKLENLG